MENAKDLNAAVTNPIRNDIGRSVNDELSSTGHSSGTSDCGMTLELVDRVEDGGHCPFGGGNVVHRDELCFGV